MTKLAVILCIAATVAPAVADDQVPRSLRMRDPRRVAQAADAAPAAPPTPEFSDRVEPAPPATEDGKTEVISVTDATVEHELFTGRAPVTVVTRAEITASGRTTLGDILQALPAQSNAGNAQVNLGGDGTSRINLRGLGTARTLVLLNGRRMVNGGAGADASVDIDAIPLPMIERVEILKDGASAIYGADAVGGVVNVITRPEYNGLDVSLLTSTSQRGDGTEYDASFVSGFTTKDKRTHLVFSGGFQGHRPVLGDDRAFSTVQKSFDFANRVERRNGSLSTPSGRLDVSSIGVGGAAPPGCTSGACKLDDDGAWTSFNAPEDLYNEAAGNYLYTPSSRYNLFGTASNRVNDNLAVLVEALFLRRSSDRQLSPVAFTADAPISKDSIYNPLGGDILDFRRRLTELGPRSYHDEATMLRFVVGLTGSVPETAPVLKGWTYELSYNHGDSKTSATTTGQLNKLHAADSLGPSMRDEEGVPICVRVPGDASTKIVYEVRGFPQPIPCVPVNLLTPAGTIAQDQLKGLTFKDQGVGNDTVRTVLATAGGQIATLPHEGKISIALGGNYRKEAGDQSPPSVASAGYSTDNFVRETEGKYNIFEGYSELAIVPFSGHPIAKWVELDLGARALRHSEFGSSLTYKAGGLFRTVQGIALRGTYATAFRAPSLRDTIGGVFQSTPAAEDPCDTQPPSAGEGRKTLAPSVQAQCTAQGVPLDSTFNTNLQIAQTGGNPDLKAETAATVTLGVVVEPPQLEGLALSADYWHIAIDDAIEKLGVQTIFANCYDRQIQSSCDLIHRDRLSHRISPVEQLLQNVDRTTSSGVDLALAYDAKIDGVGRIRAGLQGQYLVRYDLDTSQQRIHGAGFYDLGAYPHYKANLSSSWAHASGASGGFTLRYVGSYRECASNNCNNADNLAMASRDVGRYFKLDLFGGYDFRSRAGKTTLQIGVNNVLDATPPVVYNAIAANSDAATYDFVGRSAYVRLAQLF